MEIKRLATSFSYRIEPKPEGGFIARASDPSLPLLEAPTREALQQEIQSKIAGALAAQFQNLQLPILNKELNLNIRVVHKVNGGPQNQGNAVLQDPPNPGSIQLDDATMQDENFGNAKLTNVNTVGSPVSNAPITPEMGGNWKIFVALLSFLAAILMYFLFQHH